MHGVAAVNLRIPEPRLVRLHVAGPCGAAQLHLSGAGRPPGRFDLLLGLIVTPRSYLDGGTEVLPGQRKFNFSDAQPYWSPIDALGPGRNYDRQPLNPRWEQGWTRMEY